VTISSPEFLFQFTEEQSHTSVFAILPNTSLSISRYDEFTVVDGVDLTFPIDGFYTYNVFEQASGSGNLDPVGLTLVETGRAHVYLIDTAPNEYTNSTETENIYE
jgi:hypothetical protein